MILYFEGNAISNMQFKMSDGTYHMAGLNFDGQDKVRQQIVNFTEGEEILGFFGKTKKYWGEDSAHFLSMGIIINKCDTFKMSQFSSEISRREIC